MQNRRVFTRTLLGAAALADLTAQTHAAPAAGTKSLLQLQQEFLDLRFGMYIHLNMATFEQREWGDPRASPKIFNPAHLDTDQWAEAALSAGMTYGCLTTKHHDGFCLWPTETSSPSVRNATFQGDIVRSYVDSFRRHKLKPCLYYSVLDLRADIRPYQITPRKIDLIRAQLSELLTRYGEIPALIIDGWNAAWSRLTYDQIPFREIYAHVKKLQPNCLVSDYNAGQYPGAALYYTDIKQYEQHAGQKIPADSRVPSQSATTLQSVWFWKRDFPTQELRSVREIVEEWLIPFNDGHCNLILNVSPNPDGRFDQNALDRLAEIGRAWERPGPAPKIEPSVLITTPNLAFAQPSFASSSPDTVGPDLANDNHFSSYWMCDDEETSGWIEIAFRRPTAFNTVSIVEPRHAADYGTASRIADYRVQYWHDGGWVDVVSGHAPAAMQLHQFRRTTAERVRLVIDGSAKAPGIAEFGIYDEPEARYS